jgi:hypothetical protein
MDALYIRALSASEAVAAFAKIADSAFPAQSVVLSIQSNVSGISASFHDSSNTLQANQQLKKFAEDYKSRPYVLCQSANLTWQGTYSINYRSDDGVLGRITVSMQGEQPRTDSALSAIEKAFQIVPYADLITGVSDAADQAALQMRERSVADLQSQVSRLAEFLTSLAQSETEQRRRLQAEMDAAHLKRTDALEAEYRERQAAIEKQRAIAEEVLAGRERELVERVEKFETHESKYMRRDLLRQIKETLIEAEKTKISEPTARKRYWVHWFSWILLVVSLSVSGIAAFKLVIAEAVDWHLLAPLSGGFVAFVGTMIYYLKWNDRWFREHADAEFAAKRYKADILRASWVAELVHEWAKEGKGELPAELLGAYTRNLFRDTGASRVSEHPIDHLTSIMKRATEFEVGKGFLSVKGPKRERRVKPE